MEFGLMANKFEEKLSLHIYLGKDYVCKEFVITNRVEGDVSAFLGQLIPELVNSMTEEINQALEGK